MSASLAMPDELHFLEPSHLDYQHATEIGASGLRDGRAYVTWVDDQPDGRVAVAKMVHPIESLPTIIAEMQALYDLWQQRHGRRRGN